MCIPELLKIERKRQPEGNNHTLYAGDRDVPPSHWKQCRPEDSEATSLKYWGEKRRQLRIA